MSQRISTSLRYSSPTVMLMLEGELDFVVRRLASLLLLV